MPTPSVPPCTCNFTWEEMDAAASPWHRRGCPQGAAERIPPKEKRYSFHCVAPEVQGPGSTDDLDEALLFTCSYYGSHFDIWDNEKGEYVEGIHCQEDEDDLRTRLADRDGLGYALATDGYQRPPTYEGTIYSKRLPPPTWKDRLAMWSVRKVLGLLERVDHLWPK